jgi:uncharacterized protein with gpF-like domain
MAKRDKKIILRGGLIIPNAGITAWYQKQLAQFFEKHMNAAIKAILTAAYGKQHTLKSTYAQDAWVKSERVLALENELRKLAASRMEAMISGMARGMAERTDKAALFSVKTSAHALKSGLKKDDGGFYDLFNDIASSTRESEELVELAVLENVSLIKSLEGRFNERVVQLVLESITNEYGPEYLKDELLKIKAKTRSNAALIASDQTKKVFEAMSRSRMKQAGFTQYEWVYTYGAKKKEWEREYHRDVLNKKIFPLDTPIVIDPETGERGFPGTAIKCHCRKRLVIEIGA